MHQPFYRDPYTGKFALPWTRLHALKDYYGMLRVLKDYPDFKATYNLVPSLLVQLESYVAGETDIFQDMFLKDAESLKRGEIHFIVRHFFSCNYHHHILPYPRFRRLYEKKNRYLKQHPHAQTFPWERVFDTDELRDLQVWFQLTHFDEEYKAGDVRIKRLIAKGGHFGEADKAVVSEVEKELLAKIIPEYCKFFESGQIEISTTPFYHPILPLLIDPQEGRVTNPGLPEYDLDFNWREDAVFQLKLALEYMEKTFGKKPVGIWPSEGSLSTEVLSILDDLGIQWTATDEANLSKSLGVGFDRGSDFMVKNPETLYRPYSLQGNRVKVFFRDRHLSDLIGFHYRKMTDHDAARDLVRRLKNNPVSDGETIVVPVILDGENAWEYYHNSGRSFLGEFFRMVSEDDTLEAVTMSEACGPDSDVRTGKLTRFASGSWINGNFDIWIGDEEDRKGWRLLQKAKEAADKEKGLPPEKQWEIRQYLSIAQGSDWFWWFGKENFTPDLDIFDDLFRKNLRRVYEIMGKEPPIEFFVPVADSRTTRRSGVSVIMPVRQIKPHLDGEVSSYFEWIYAGRADVENTGGAMNIANPLVRRVYFGFDANHFYLRIDTRKKAAVVMEKAYTLDMVIKKSNRRKRLTLYPPIPPISPTATVIRTEVGKIIEVAVPLKVLNLKKNDSLQFQLEWRVDGNLFQVVPSHEYFKFSLPSPKDYAHSWFV